MWGDGRCEERQTGYVSVFVCVWRERCSLVGVLVGVCVYVLCRDVCV